MELLDKLARTDMDPALLAQVRAMFTEKDFKITALTHELAYYRRVLFGKTGETLAGPQRRLFEETVDMDLAAIEEELEGEVPAKRQRKRAGRQPLPPELPRIEHRHEPELCQCGQCGADLAKIGEDISRARRVRAFYQAAYCQASRQPQNNCLQSCRSDILSIENSWTQQPDFPRHHPTILDSFCDFYPAVPRLFSLNYR